jgi:hypothetical protein
VDPLAIDIGPERGRHSILELVADGVLDARLAALAWVLLERRVSLLVAAGPSGTGKTVLLRALLPFLPPKTVGRTVAGEWETWSWLPPEVTRAVGAIPGRAAVADGRRERGDGSRVSPDVGLAVVPEFSNHLPIYASGFVARTAIRLASAGYVLAGTIHAETLREALTELGASSGASADELAALGLALVVRAVDGRRADSRRRVVAAHYVRPVARDVHGHVQRLDPAVLATWDPTGDRLEDFSWGVTPELAARFGMRAGDLEAEVGRRASYLDALVTAGVRGERETVAAIRAYATPVRA